MSLPAEPATQEALRFRGESVAALATGVAEEVVGVDSEVVQQVRVLLRIDLIWQLSVRLRRLFVAHALLDERQVGMDGGPTPER